ncbi:MAG: Druantia anti-phage system protein DruA [Candidatus Acidiferrales bacterium]
MAVETAQRIQGRWIGAEDIVWLREWMAAHPEWSRKRFARELCAVWGWRDGAGRLKDFAARSFLLKLEARGHIRLPALRPRSLTGFRRPVHEPAERQERPVFAASLDALQPLQIEVVETGTATERRWSFYLSRYHYLGLRVVGENLGYLVSDAQGRDVACLLFGAAAWRCAPRDRHLGWDGAERAAGLAQIANNTRFLILPWVRAPLLASHVLGLIIRRIDADWRKKYGHGLRWLETFVERERFRGTCYRAANWRCVGQTTGRSRQDRDKCLRVPVKDIYLYPLAGGRR